MNLRQIGKSDVMTTPIVFGAWAIGGWLWGGTDDAKAVEGINAAIDAGIKAIDTAPVYGFGHSESVVGEAIKGRRDEVLVFTKCGLRWDDAPGPHHFDSEDNEGNEVVIKSVVESFSSTYPVDTRGGALRSYPIMLGIKNLANIDFIFSFSAGYPGTVEWVQYAADPLDKPFSTGCTAVQVTEVVPFVQSGQCKGILGGLSGAAEFERLLVDEGYLDELGPGNRGMAAQSVAHMVMVAFIIVGNVAYYFERRRQKKY